MDTGITISGNIIGELSDKIPSNIIALNELIKNAYDAGATKAKIILNSKEGTLTISDNGSGMDENDIKKLFHISKSDKKYGEINQFGRITQGSKGLGFLSVFKFGGKVTWKTKKDNCKGLTFSANYAEIIKENDIANHKIIISECEIVKKGTIINISLDGYNSKTLIEYFSDSKNYQKSLYAFADNNFKIEIDIDGDLYSNSNVLNIQEQLKEKQLFYVEYNSENDKIVFYKNGVQIHTEQFNKPSLPFSVDLRITIYSLRSGDKAKFDRLFYNPNDALTPLVFVNDNIFNNYTLFDPNLMQQVKTSFVLSQMIGFVNIISSDSNLAFNSDRTQFLQNELTDNITDFLKELNAKIQRVGSSIKKALNVNTFLTVEELPFECSNATNIELRKYIKDDYFFKDCVEIEKSDNIVKYTVLNDTKELKILPLSLPDLQTLNDNKPAHTHRADKGNNVSEANNVCSDTTEIIPAIIKLKQKTKRVATNSSQIDLLDFIDIAKNSSGEIILKNQITVKVDNVPVDPPILSSRDKECVIIVLYQYEDIKTGCVNAQLTLEVYQPQSSINTSTGVSPLFSLPTNQAYRFSFDTTVSNLYAQLNTLQVDEYLEVMACCIRPIFEISVDAVLKSKKFTFSRKGNLQNIPEFVEHISKSKTYKQEISQKTGIDFQSLGNLLSKSNYENLISNANLGAHKSTMYITKNDIEDLIKKMTIFLVIVNEMINNPNIT